MNKRYLPISAVTAVLFVAALAGYLLPAGSEGPPVRILLENKGGKVIFQHKSHIAIQDAACGSCHHTTGDGSPSVPCSSCHVKQFDDAFIAAHQEAYPENQCSACHHPKATIGNFSHDGHVDDYGGEDCELCHHASSIEEEPEACAHCHDTPASPDIPNLREAAHSRCADCHQDEYLRGFAGCPTCHVREMAPPEPPDTEACSNCHTEPLEELVPTTASAFHGKCMGCHEENDAGPFGDDACYQCHMQ